MEIQTEFIYKAAITIDTVQELGQTQTGNRRIIPITGGTFEGPALSGKILPGGADWQIIRPDGSAWLEARYTMQTDSGALIYVENQGYRHGPAEIIARMANGEILDPDLYYMRTTPFFETSDPDLAWLNHTICVCTGAREPDCVILEVFAVR
jgi:hypothetical protein